MDICFWRCWYGCGFLNFVISGMCVMFGREGVDGVLFKWMCGCEYSGLLIK